LRKALIIFAFISGVFFGSALIIVLEWRSHAGEDSLIIKFSKPFSEDEISALRGSREASSKILLSYEICSKSYKIPRGTEADCGKFSKLWARIDAENGSVSGYSSMYHDLFRSKNCFDLNRAKFYLDKLINESDNKYIWVKENDRFDEKLKSCT